MNYWNWLLMKDWRWILKMEIFPFPSAYVCETGFSIRCYWGKQWKLFMYIYIIPWNRIVIHPTQTEEEANLIIMLKPLNVDILVYSKSTSRKFNMGDYYFTLNFCLVTYSGFKKLFKHWSNCLLITYMYT